MRQSQREQHVSHHAQDGNNDLQMPQQQLKLVVGHRGDRLKVYC